MDGRIKQCCKCWMLFEVPMRMFCWKTCPCERTFQRGEKRWMHQPTIWPNRVGPSGEAESQSCNGAQRGARPSGWAHKTVKSKNGGYHGVADVTFVAHFRADCVKGNNAAVMKKRKQPGGIWTLVTSTNVVAQLVDFLCSWSLDFKGLLKLNGSMNGESIQ